jgi:hypothetical protein
MIQELLEAREGLLDLVRPAKIGDGIGNRAIYLRWSSGLSFSESSWCIQP